VSAALLERIKDIEHTCAKLHDLNHMQAQRIEVLETQYATAFRERAEAEVALVETRRECATLKAQAESRAKRIYELEQERIVLCEGNKKMAAYCAEMRRHTKP
jgi:septal ring factor EnvC (AmiA/AmiB activator)